MIFQSADLEVIKLADLVVGFAANSKDSQNHLETQRRSSVQPLIGDKVLAFKGSFEELEQTELPNRHPWVD